MRGISPRGGLVKFVSVTDLRHRADPVPVREEFFAEKLPASRLIEAEAIAVA